jgi:hypothetical protein
MMPITTVQQGRPRTWRFPRPMVVDQVALAVMLWAGFALTVLCVIIGINYFSGSLNYSVWETASQAVPWYCAIMTGRVLYQVFPMFVAHGRTRRNAAIEAGISSAILAAVAAMLTVVGYLLELALYRSNDWSTNLEEDHLYSRHSQIGTIFLESILIYLVWAGMGAFVGATLYRFGSIGWFSVLPAAAVASLVGIFWATDSPFFSEALDRFRPEFAGTIPMAIVSSLIGVTIFSGFIWAVVRDVPIVKR